MRGRTVESGKQTMEVIKQADGAKKIGDWKNNGNKILKNQVTAALVGTQASISGKHAMHPFVKKRHESH